MLYRLIFIVLALLLSGTVRAVEPIIIGPNAYPAGINPLTGLPVDDPETLNRRPLLVKVSDYPPLVRPQSGLMDADIVWEHLRSGGVTRFSAIYLGRDTPHVGPIRSGRLVDFELTRIYRALFVYSGMAQGTIDVLRGDRLVSSRAIGGVDPCPALCRFPREGVALEHTLFGDTAALRELAVARGKDVTPEPVYGMAFSDQPPADGLPVAGVRVQYRETEIVWTYDADAGRWLRSQDGEPHFDALHETQISAANVLVVEEEHTVQPVVADGYWGPGNFAFSVNFIGSGRAVLCRDGRCYEGEWRRAARSEPLQYVLPDGSALPFKPGNTFVNLMPRWIDGYQLVFELAQAPRVTVVGSGGVNMRVGPGDVFEALGRNRATDWLQLRRPEDATVIWMPVSALDLAGLDAAGLPLARPTNER